MKIIKNNQVNHQFGVTLEENASALTQGHVYGLRYEGWSQRYP